MKDKRTFKVLTLLLAFTLVMGVCVFPMSAADSLRGDMNEDGKVTSDDALYLLRHTLKKWEYTISQSGDLNADKEVDSNDAIYLLRHVLQPKKYPLLECGHSMEAHTAKDAACTENGSLPYWSCVFCNKYFSDENGENEIAFSDTIIPAKHTGGTEIRNAKEPTEIENGYTGDTYCLGCGELLSHGVVIPNTPSVIVSRVSVSGDKVEAVISITNNPGIVSLKFDVLYDDILSIQSIEFSGAFGAYATSPEPYINPQTINWINPNGNIVTNGEFVTITFLVDLDVTERTEAEIRLLPDNANIFNSDMEQIRFGAVGATVTVNE